MPRLILVSNRLPLTVRLEHGQVAVTRSAGGLVTGLRGPHERTGGLWIGWPGDVSRLTDAQRRSLDESVQRLKAQSKLCHGQTAFTRNRPLTQPFELPWQRIFRTVHDAQIFGAADLEGRRPVGGRLLDAVELTANATDGSPRHGCLHHA